MFVSLRTLIIPPNKHIFEEESKYSISKYIGNFDQIIGTLLTIYWYPTDDVGNFLVGLIFNLMPLFVDFRT